MTDKAKIINLLKSDHFDLGIELCKSQGFNPVELITEIVLSINKSCQLLLNGLLIYKTGKSIVWYSCQSYEIMQILNCEIMHDELKDFDDYELFAKRLYEIFLLKNKHK